MRPLSASERKHAARTGLQPRQKSRDVKAVTADDKRCCDSVRLHLPSVDAFPVPALAKRIYDELPSRHAVVRVILPTLASGACGAVAGPMIGAGLGLTYSAGLLTSVAGSISAAAVLMRQGSSFVNGPFLAVNYGYLIDESRLRTAKRWPYSLEPRHHLGKLTGESPADWVERNLRHAFAAGTLDDRGDHDWENKLIAMDLMRRIKEDKSCGWVAATLAQDEMQARHLWSFHWIAIAKVMLQVSNEVLAHVYLSRDQYEQLSSGCEQMLKLVAIDDVRREEALANPHDRMPGQTLSEIVELIPRTPAAAQLDAKVCSAVRALSGTKAGAFTSPVKALAVLGEGVNRLEEFLQHSDMATREDADNYDIDELLDAFEDERRGLPWFVDDSFHGAANEHYVRSLGFEGEQANEDEGNGEDDSAVSFHIAGFEARADRQSGATSDAGAPQKNARDIKDLSGRRFHARVAAVGEPAEVAATAARPARYRRDGAASTGRKVHHARGENRALSSEERALYGRNGGRARAYDHMMAVNFRREQDRKNRGNAQNGVPIVQR